MPTAITKILQKHATKGFGGFTLVELSVVIMILAMLGTIGFVQLRGYQGSARDASRVSDINNIAESLELTFMKTNSYPNPDNSFSITYSGGSIWIQGTVGDSFMNFTNAGGSNLSKKPTDPLISGKEYTYSKLAYGNEYLIKTDYEGESIALDSAFFINQAAAAAGKPNLSYIKGNYNGIVTKTQTGSMGTYYLLAVPSIITSFSGTADVTALSNTFLIHGETNSGGVTYNSNPVTNPNFILSSSCALPSTETQKVLFTSKIALAYSGTILANQANITPFINSYGNTGALLDLGEKLLTSYLGASKSTVNNASDICTSWVYSEYEACKVDNTQARTIVASLPCGCTGGTPPPLIQSCVYTPTMSNCPSGNTSTNNTTATKAQILANINAYIGCTPSGITDAVIAGYTYSGSISEANKMVLMTGTGDEIGTPWWGNWADAGGATDNISNVPNMIGSIYGWDGMRNTITSANNSGPGYAAYLCYGKGSGWYLPAGEELNQLYCYSNQASFSDAGYTNNGSFGANCPGRGYLGKDIGSLTGFNSNRYWSSTEVNANNAWYQLMGNGYRYPNLTKDNSHSIRCTRRF